MLSPLLLDKAPASATPATVSLSKLPFLFFFGPPQWISLVTPSLFFPFCLRLYSTAQAGVTTVSTSAPPSTTTIAFPVLPSMATHMNPSSPFLPLFHNNYNNTIIHHPDSKSGQHLFSLLAFFWVRKQQKQLSRKLGKKDIKANYSSICFPIQINNKSVSIRFSDSFQHLGSPPIC